MDKQKEEQQAFDMAKQDVPFLRHLKVIDHNDRPDFILEDENGRKIGLEHFRADVYRVQDMNSPHVSGGHTILNKAKCELFEKYHPFSVNDTWNDSVAKSASNDLAAYIKESFDMQCHYTYEDFLDNLHVCIHGKPPKIKGHIQKSKHYPERTSYDLMGFLIEIPVPSFYYYFETSGSQRISQLKSSLCGSPLYIPDCIKPTRRFNDGYSFQKINGLPITYDIWKELNVFEDIDFVIIETYNAISLQEHHGQYFDRNTPKLKIYPAFSFGLTEVKSIDTHIEHINGSSNIACNYHTYQAKDDVIISKTQLKNERLEQNRKSRKHFDDTTRKFRGE